MSSAVEALSGPMYESVYDRVREYWLLALACHGAASGRRVARCAENSLVPQRDFQSPAASVRPDFVKVTRDKKTVVSDEDDVEETEPAATGETEAEKKTSPVQQKMKKIRYRTSLTWQGLTWNWEIRKTSGPSSMKSCRKAMRRSGKRPGSYWNRQSQVKLSVMKIAAGVEYDGSRYSGWQIQKHSSSVQARVEAALSAVADHTVAVTCAGRTDAGVHALSQVVQL